MGRPTRRRGRRTLEQDPPPGWLVENPPTHPSSLANKLLNSNGNEDSPRRRAIRKTGLATGASKPGTRSSSRGGVVKNWKPDLPPRGVAENPQKRHQSPQQLRLIHVRMRTIWVRENDELVDQALKHLLCTVESKKMTRSRAIQYITILLGSYDCDNSAPEVEEIEGNLSRVRINKIHCLIILQYVAKLKWNYRHHVVNTLEPKLLSYWPRKWSDSPTRFGPVLMKR